MSQQELSPHNYKRISIISGLLSIPLIFLFAWPYIYVAEVTDLEIILRYTGSFLFSLPFTLTILHGYVTIALGEPHRHHYYEWLIQHPKYGLLFHPIIVRTRFRLILLAISFLLLLTGVILNRYGSV